mmetsp:Transcript_52215/g.127526  ORF Transcript_52215/g.127526 Transcript_52215/m.127526 type:complete len:263 (-) Transcript_52215:197-985(-)
MYEAFSSSGRIHEAYTSSPSSVPAWNLVSPSPSSSGDRHSWHPPRSPEPSSEDIMIRKMGVHSSAPFLSALVTVRSQKSTIPSAATVMICFDAPSAWVEGVMLPVRGATSRLGGSHWSAETALRWLVSMVLAIAALMLFTSSLALLRSSSACDAPRSRSSLFALATLAAFRSQYSTCPLAQPAASRFLFLGLNLKVKMSPGASSTNCGWMGSLKFQIRMCDDRTFPSRSTCSSIVAFSVHDTATTPFESGIQSMALMILRLE